ncbi:hypothetical protein AeRB84_015086 [Aphanomyces euteiches]|nr:hypothetical protein AeRB84_015086 [Aphanomyces euteiches]
MSGYVLYLLWTRYYRHYCVLFGNLRGVGISPEYVRYQIVVGDPAYAILRSMYTALAITRLTQFHDVWLYITGCMYLARYVSFSYLFMRIFSLVVKWQRWETTFSPADPGFLAIAAYIYSGPIMSVFGCTAVHVWFGYFINSWTYFCLTGYEIKPWKASQVLDITNLV